MPDRSKFLVSGPICGSVTESSAQIKATVRNAVKTASLRLSKAPDLSNPILIAVGGRWEDAKKDFEHHILTFDLIGLEADTEYYFGLDLEYQIEPNAKGRFKTFPHRGTRTNFTFAFAGCSDGDNSAAFDAIRNHADVSFFVHLGDLHYRNPRKANVARRLAYYEDAIQRSGPANLLRRAPLAYTWDDHDFFRDNTGGDTDSDARQARLAARQAYDIFFPHYRFPDGSEQPGIYQSFLFGRVLFLLTDVRYSQSARSAPDGPQKVILGDQQLAWLEREFNRASEFDLIVMTSSHPWIGDSSDGHDSNWIGCPTARRQLANIIKNRNVSNLCMIGADAHMLAIDNGSHSGYAELPGVTGKGGFPVFVAGPLNNQGNRKGGPYSHGKESASGGESGVGVSKTGIFSSNRQFGLCEISYANSAASPTVKWSGWRVEGGIAKKKLWYEFKGGATAPDFF